MKQKYKYLILFCGLLILPSYLLAHGGRTNDSGCHNNNETGEYHCHKLSNDNNLSSINDNQVKNSIKIKSKAKPKVKPSASNYYYDRGQWSHWADSDHDCQNTRAEVLISRSKINVLYRNTKKCSVVYGRWIDPYSGKFISMAKDIDIDHVVPLSWANSHGGFYWSKSKKKQFSNDWENLLIVSDTLNQLKGDNGPYDWLPPNVSYHCEYIRLFDSIVKKYDLVYRLPEKEFVRTSLRQC